MIVQYKHGCFFIIAAVFVLLIWKLKNYSYYNEDTMETLSISENKIYEQIFDSNIPLFQQILKSHLTKEQITKHCHKDWFLPPSLLPYNLLNYDENTRYFSQEKQDQFVDNYLKEKRNGIFLEVGAANGVRLSNSLFFERERGWSGLLIEPNRKYYDELVTVHRKSYIVNSCLSLDGKISTANFITADLIGGVEEGYTDSMRERVKSEFPNAEQVEVLCIPIYSILQEINMKHIDFFTLDVEGAELQILKTIPFNNVTINVFCIEYAITSDKGVNYQASKKKLNDIRAFFRHIGGYKEIKDNNQDVFFAKV